MKPTPAMNLMKQAGGQSVSRSYDVKKTNLKTLTLSGATSTSSVFFPKSRKDLAGLPRKKEFSKKLTTKNATQKEQNTSSSNLRETAYQSSDCDTRRANGVLGSRSCVVNKCALSADFLPPFLPSKFAVEVRSLAIRSRRSVQSSLARCQVRRLRSSDVELSNSQSLQDIWTRSAFFRFKKKKKFPSPNFCHLATKKNPGHLTQRNVVKKMRQSRHIFSGNLFFLKSSYTDI